MIVFMYIFSAFNCWLEEGELEYLLIQIHDFVFLLTDFDERRDGHGHQGSAEDSPSGDESSNWELREEEKVYISFLKEIWGRSCLLYTSPSPRDKRQSRMPSSA